jgi:hypothetical protein
MSHNQRLYWLRTLGFTAQDRGIIHGTLGTCSLVTGERQGETEEFWLAAHDGSALVHRSSLPVMTWAELQAWITEQPEAKKPLEKQRNLLVGQKSLFGDE